MSYFRHSGWITNSKLSHFIGIALCVSALALVGLAPASGGAAAPMPDPVFVGAGDIATCSHTHDEATALLLDDIAGTVFTLGDNVYQDGKLTEFNDCYDPSWGRHKARTRPAPGNHDYHTSGAAGYYTYFGKAASPLDSNCTDHCLGYYSYDLGAWHIIVLNSEIARDAGSEQEQWLQADLAAHDNVCTLAYWHKPLFSSGQHGNNPSLQTFWQDLYEAGADVVLNGHDHIYERFALQDPNGKADPTHGLREFVVGTGGAGLYDFTTIQANSQVRNNTTWGVLKLTLHPTSYDWEFVPVAGQTFSDAGSANCVATGPTPTETSTNTATPTEATATATLTGTLVVSATATATLTATSTLTSTATDSATPTPTDTATASPTATSTDTPTATKTPSETPPPTALPTETPTLQPTATTPGPRQGSRRQFLPLISR